MNAATKAPDISPDSVLPSIKPGTKKMDLISSFDHQNQEVGANLDRLTLNLNGTQEQAKRMVFLIELAPMIQPNDPIKNGETTLTMMMCNTTTSYL